MQPVFIVGVPRSGTTLLRVVLDSHPCLKVGPECPWISGNYGQLVSFRHLYESLTMHRSGPVANLSGVSEQTIANAVRLGIDHILAAHAQGNNKRRWLEKTPDNIAAISFLNTIFPDAKYIHVVRDGRDVACSSYKCRDSWGEYINFGDARIENTILNCLRRWVAWERQFRSWETELRLDVIHLRYEDLISTPRISIGRVLEFIDEPWNDAVLDYLNFSHELPGHEMGSGDVARKRAFSEESIGRWRSEFSIVDKLKYKSVAGETLRSLGYL